MSRVDEAMLAVVLLDNGTYPIAADITRGLEFQDPRLGMIFDGIGAVIASGRSVSTLDVEDYYQDWGVRGVDQAEPFRWVSEIGGHSAWVLVHGVARNVRASYVRRRGAEILSRRMSDLSDAGNQPEDVLTEMLREVQELDMAQAKDEESHISLGELMATVDPEPEWVIPRLMERQDRLMLTGPEGHGKSTLVRQLVIMAAAGLHPFTYEEMKPPRVLVIDAENTRRQWKRGTIALRGRARSYGYYDPDETIRIANTRRLNILDMRDATRLLSWVDEVQPDIVTIGPLYRIVDGSLNDEDTASAALTFLDKIRDRGIALIVEAHSPHATEKGGDRTVRPRGSSSLMGWPEFGYGLRPDEDASNRYDLVAWRGAREEREWPLALFRGSEWPWSPGF